MIRKRDGPASQSTTPGPEQGVNERPAPLPQAKTSRNPLGHTSPSSHRRVKRRQPQGWREFSVRLVAPPSSEGATALYAYLRAAAKRFGLEVASVDEIHDDKSKVKKETGPSA